MSPPRVCLLILPALVAACLGCTPSESPPASESPPRARRAEDIGIPRSPDTRTAEQPTDASAARLPTPSPPTTHEGSDVTVDRPTGDSTPIPLADSAPVPLADTTPDGSTVPAERSKREPWVKLRAPSAVVGSLDKSIVRRVVRHHRSAFNRCYHRTLEKTPGVSGAIEVQFTILRIGLVEDVTVLSNTTGSAMLEACVVERVERMRFPSAKGGGIVIVRYPFVFVAGD